MIPRYEKKSISEIWTNENKFKCFLNVELAIMRALEGDKVPKGTADKIQKEAKINPARIDEIEQTTRHDIIAFCTSITENLDPKIGKFFHFGVTSSDIIDSAMNLQIKQSLDIILPAYKKLLTALKDRAIEQKGTLAMGRSHGMFAEPLSMGQKILGFYNEFARHYKDLQNFYQTQLTCQLSGAVGNYTILSIEQEKKAAKDLGLQVEALSTQVIPRDHIAKLVSINALIATAIERISVEIRHLHRSEVGEIHEGFKKGQKGSSTMPHKKNPISGENLTGMARILKSHLSMALENVVLWHERDISHSSTERMYLPDHFGILLYSIERLTSTVEDLVFHKEVIEARVFDNFMYLSSYYLHALIEQLDVPREDLYPIVQAAAFKGMESGLKEDFYNEIKKLVDDLGHSVNLPSPSETEIRKIFLGSVDEIFERSFERYPLN